jgi:phospholipid transport system substrate-binding protein
MMKLLQRTVTSARSRHRRRLTSVSWIAWLALALTTPAHAEAQAASAIPAIDRFHATLLTAMKDADKLGYEGRRKLIEPVIDDTMDVPFMAEKAAGRFWKDFSESDRVRWVAAFRGNTVANYAGRFNRFSGQSFVSHGEEPAPFDTVLVKTTLKDPGGEDVQLNYRMKKEADRWRIIDIFMHGTVSELALRRAEYSSALERDGLDKVVQSLEGQAAKLSSGADASGQ